MSIDYKAMQVGDRIQMPVPATWEGTNQDLFREVQAYCQTVDPAPQFQVDNVRAPGKALEFWLERIR